MTVSKRLTFWNRSLTFGRRSDVSQAFDRLNEEAVFAEVYKEVEAGDIREGLWAQALVKSDGDSTKAKIEYMKLRVQSLKDELILREAAE